MNKKIKAYLANLKTAKNLAAENRAKGIQPGSHQGVYTSPKYTIVEIDGVKFVDLNAPPGSSTAIA